jgi:hypothetical protein
LGTLSAEKQVLLNGFLGQLPEQIAARLAKAVEVDRLIGGTGLPHDDILRALRPQLRQSPLRARMPTPQRFFCRPFEDLLVSPERKIKQKGRIARTSIEPVWSWLAVELMPHRHRDLNETLRDAILHNREDEIQEKIYELWAEASAALAPALAGEKKKSAAARKLGGVAVVEDAEEIALVLGRAPELDELQKRLPKPIPALNDEDTFYLRSLFDRMSDVAPEFAPYIPLIVMGRLERPWEAMRLAGALSRRSDDTVISATDVGIVGELLFSDLDSYVKRIQIARPFDFDADAMVANLASFAELSSGMVKEIGIRRDGKWGQRLAKDRSAVAQVVEGFLERAPREIQAALASSRVGGFGKSPKPLDLARLPDPERVAKAMRYAHLMIHSRPFAVAAAFNAKLAETIDETADALRSHSEDLLREVRAAAPETRASLEAHLKVFLDLCALVLGEEETEILRRRSRMLAHA